MMRAAGAPRRLAGPGAAFLAALLALLPACGERTPAGPRLEPHKREHAQEVLARDPYASLSVAERTAMQARLGDLRPQYDRYMRLAAIAD